MNLTSSQLRSLRRFERTMKRRRMKVYPPKETFVEYITRPTGFGKTPWPLAILIHLFGVAGIVMAVTDSAWGMLGLMGPTVLWWGTWMNYKGKWV